MIPERLKTFLRRKTFLIICAISVLVIFPTYNKYWAPFDEGIVTVAGELVLRGEVPYRDFFVANYPPGQFYVLGLLYRIFGVTLETGRFYTVLVHVLIAMCVFLITRALTKKTIISLITWFISLTCLAPRLGALPFPIWPGMAFSLLAIYLFIRYIEEEKLRHLFYSALMIGAAIVFRHDIGAYAFGAIFMSLVIYPCAKDFGLEANKRPIWRIAVFISGSLVLPLLFLVYFFWKQAAQDLFASLVTFPAMHMQMKEVALTFPKPCFDFSMIFHQSLYFIKINQYYIPLLVYAFIALLLMGGFVKQRKLGKKETMLFSLAVFGLLSFNQVRVRTDPAHLLTSIYPAILLFGFILSESIFNNNMRKGRRYAFFVYAIILSFLFSLLVIKNLDKSFKNILRKPYKGSVVAAKFKRGTVYIPKEEKTDIANVVSFIKSFTASGEHIYVGNIAHWKDDFGGSTILYFLADRLPSTKQHNKEV